MKFPIWKKILADWFGMTWIGYVCDRLSAGFDWQSTQQMCRFVTFLDWNRVQSSILIFRIENWLQLHFESNDWIEIERKWTICRCHHYSCNNILCEYTAETATLIATFRTIIRWRWRRIRAKASKATRTRRETFSIETFSILGQEPTRMWPHTEPIG